MRPPRSYIPGRTTTVMFTVHVTVVAWRSPPPKQGGRAIGGVGRRVELNYILHPVKWSWKQCYQSQRAYAADGLPRMPQTGLSFTHAKDFGLGRKNSLNCHWSRVALKGSLKTSLIKRNYSRKLHEMWIVLGQWLAADGTFVTCADLTI